APVTSPCATPPATSSGSTSRRPRSRRRTLRSSPWAPSGEAVAPCGTISWQGRIMFLSESSLDELAEAIAAGTAVAGLGESTRFAHETFAARDRLLRRLVERH